MNVVMSASEVVPKLMGEQNDEQRNGERQAREKHGGMVKRHGERPKQVIEGGRLIVCVCGGKMRTGNQRSDQSQKE